MIREAALMCMTPRLAEIRPLLSQFICPFHGYFLDSDKARPVRTTCSLSETSAPDTSLSLREIAGNLHRYGKRKAPKNDDCENYLGLSKSFFGGQIALLIFEVTSAFFWKISMVDIDEILASAIRTAWLEISGPELRSPHHIEVETAQRVRHALEREGIIITPSRPMPEAAVYEGRRNSG